MDNPNARTLPLTEAKAEIDKLVDRFAWYLSLAAQTKEEIGRKLMELANVYGPETLMVAHDAVKRLEAAKLQQQAVSTLRIM